MRARLLHRLRGQPVGTSRGRGPVPRSTGTRRNQKATSMAPDSCRTKMHDPQSGRGSGEVTRRWAISWAARPKRGSPRSIGVNRPRLSPTRARAAPVLPGPTRAHGFSRAPAFTAHLLQPSPFRERVDAAEVDDAVVHLEHLAGYTAPVEAAFCDAPAVFSQTPPALRVRQQAGDEASKSLRFLVFVHDHAVDVFEHRLQVAAPRRRDDGQPRRHGLNLYTGQRLLPLRRANE